jgi:hypothetical protein
MSRQNKAMQKAKLARAVTALHLKGEKGPAKTERKHGKQDKNRHYTNLTRGLKDMANSRKRQDGIGGA